MIPRENEAHFNFLIMKNLIIADLIILLFIFGIIINVSHTKYINTKHKLKTVTIQLDSIRMNYRNHIDKCAWISKNQIQSKHGRYIILYSSNNTNRK